MFLLRTFCVAPTTRASISSISTSRASFATFPRLASGSDYGSGAQKNEKNLEKESQDQEHPGPAPPSTGGKKSSSSKSSGKGVESGSESSSSGGGAQPKILSDSPPKEHEQSEEVKSHNKEVKERAEASFQSNEKKH